MDVRLPEVFARADLSRVVAQLMPVIEARVARTLLRRRRDGRDPRQELADLVQEVLVSLLEDNARVLRTWNPSRGLSLENFVGLVAEREVLSVLRNGRRTPYRSETEELHEDMPEASVDAVDQVVSSRELLTRMVDLLRLELSPLGLILFERLVVLEEGVDHVAQSMSMSLDAVYAWRSRLLRRLRQLALELTRSSSQVKLQVATP
jgi:RNA polymerase sigma-70 factor (ECF subfamily)